MRRSRGKILTSYRMPEPPPKEYVEKLYEIITSHPEGGEDIVDMLALKEMLQSHAVV